MKTVLYARVSTTEQNIEHQLTQARAAGFVIHDDDVVTDEGVSGVSTALWERPGGKHLRNLGRGDTLVVRWVDRLGRNYVDVTDALRELLRKGVVVRTIINGMTFDGAETDPMKAAVRDALIGFMAATAQAQAEATKEAQKAGIAAAREKDEKYRGRRPEFTREQFEQVCGLLGEGASPTAISRDLEMSRAMVYRIKDEPTKMASALTAWGL
jgi:putative DNA-invertase from lambdoid prophage Rac